MKVSSAKRKRMRLFRLQRGRCYWCPTMMRLLPGYEDSCTLDHIVPRARGGSNDAWNLCAACWLCNQRRGDQMGAPTRQVKPKAFVPMRHGGPALKHAEWMNRRRQAICHVFAPLLGLEHVRHVMPIVKVKSAPQFGRKRFNSMSDAMRDKGLAA